VGGSRIISVAIDSRIEVARFAGAAILRLLLRVGSLPTPILEPDSDT